MSVVSCHANGLLFPEDEYVRLVCRPTTTCSFD